VRAPGLTPALALAGGIAVAALAVGSAIAGMPQSGAQLGSPKAPVTLRSTATWSARSAPRGSWTVAVARPASARALDRALEFADHLERLLVPLSECAMRLSLTLAGHRCQATREVARTSQSGVR
jgi:hypothetical protein